MSHLSHSSNLSAGLEPSVETIELACDRLADLGLAVGPDTARDFVRAILAAEAPRLDARVREALATSLETIRTATQSALGMLAATTAGSAPTPGHVAAPTSATASTRPPLRSAPLATPPPPPPEPPVESRRPIARRGPPSPEREPLPPAPAPGRDRTRGRDPDPADDLGARPVFKRPRGR